MKYCKRCETKLELLKGTSLWHCSKCQETSSDFIDTEEEGEASNPVTATEIIQSERIVQSALREIFKEAVEKIKASKAEMIAKIGECPEINIAISVKPDLGKEHIFLAETL